MKNANTIEISFIVFKYLYAIMVNTLREGDNNLVRLDYTSLLTAILEALENPQADNLFRLSNKGKHLRIDIDNVAYSLATNTNSNIEMPFSSWQGMRVATTNFTESSKDVFVERNRKIRDCLQQHLESLLSDNNHESIEKFLPKFWTELTKFQGQTSSQISLEYDFNKKYSGLSKQRLTLKQEEGAYPKLKFHRLTITIKDTNNIFDNQLKKSLENYTQLQFKDEADKDELNNILEYLYENRDKTDSGWYAVKRLMDNEAIPKVQRTAKIKYLEYLLENIGKDNDAIHLEILIHRLQELERYLDDPNKTDGDYQVSYAGESFNIKEIFSRAEAFDRLPIIPVVDGSLGESRDENKGELNFTFGLKLKLAGKIQTEGAKTVLEYNLDLLNPDSKRHQEDLANESKKFNCARRTIQIAVLYFFVFAGNNPNDKDYKIESDLEYDAIDKFENNILPVLKNSAEEPKTSLLKNIIKGIRLYQTETKISKLRELLKTKIKRKQLWNSRAYPIQINLKKGILETDANVIDDRNNFFVNDLNKKTALKYISVTDSNIDTNSLCYFSGDIKISDIGYFDTVDNQEFSMEYLTGKFPTIPVILYPDESDRRCIKKEFRESNLIIFAYGKERLKNIFDGSNPQAEFIYRFVFSLLSHISLKILLDTAINRLNRRLFIPILRLHLGDKIDPLEEEVFLRSNFAILSHLINANHRSNTQGISVKSLNAYKIKNALSSLYNILPKKFILKENISNPKIDKLAIIIVSSRESDRSWRGDYKIANLTGEVIKIDRKKDNSISIYTSKTLSHHYNSDRLFQDPDILVKEVDRLYQDGYRHILYIASSPYSKTLKLNNKDDDLYFMNSSVIGNLKGNKEDLKIYPIFFDKYYVVSLQNIGRKSLYIQDAEELTNIVNDPSKKIAVFFNLFNGIQIGKQEDRYYNGVMSYSTLLNVYDQKLLDTDDIYAGLINNDLERGFKQEILQLLTLFHFSRYEADNKDIQLKLDPYQNIIGDQSVGALSIFSHMQPKISFNLLAFLNEVNDALDAKIELLRS